MLSFALPTLSQASYKQLPKSPRQLYKMCYLGVDSTRAGDSVSFEVFNLDAINLILISKCEAEGEDAIVDSGVRCKLHLGPSI